MKKQMYFYKGLGVLYLMLMLGWSGCSFIAQRVLEKPKVSIEQIELQDLKSDGATVVFGVKVENPNGIGLKLDSLRYEIEMGERPLSQGQLRDVAEVPARGATVVPIPVQFKYSDVFASMIDFLTKKTSQYRIKGEARAGILTVPFDRSGELKLQ